MSKATQRIIRLLLLAPLCSLLASPLPTPAADKLLWRADRDRVDAEITAWSLPHLLETVASTTGWQIFLEPDTSHVVSTKFTDRPTGEALRLLLGELNFALLPQPQAPSKLFVFRTNIGQATHRIHPPSTNSLAKPIPNELIVKIKPGADIDAIAKELGAKVTGRAPELDVYRLQFEDEDAANRARELLSKHTEIASVESNYSFPAPPDRAPLSLTQSDRLSLHPKAVGESGQVIVGLIDTAIQPTGGPVDQFLLPSLSLSGETVALPATPTHATAMSETILRGIAMMNQGDNESAVRILPVDVYGSQETSSTFDVAYGIYQAINAGAMIINLSLGSEGNTPFLQQVIQSGHAQGVIFFAAAGNQPVDSPTFPAAYPEVVAVTAGDRRGQISPYANYGDFIDVIAPDTTLITYNGQSYVIRGTSSAAAYASGMAAALADRASFATAEAAIRKNLAVPRKQ